MILGYYQEYRKNKINERNYKNLFDANYFITSKPYYQLDKFSIDGTQDNEKPYSKALTKELSFYMFYAMDWMSQLNFFIIIILIIILFMLQVVQVLVKVHKFQNY